MGLWGSTAGGTGFIPHGGLRSHMSHGAQWKKERKERNHDLLKKRLILGLGQEIFKKSLGYLLVPESKELKTTSALIGTCCRESVANWKLSQRPKMEQFE